jgi:hypothetical protein
MTLKLGLVRIWTQLSPTWFSWGFLWLPPTLQQYFRKTHLQIWYPAILYHKITSYVFRASLNHLRFVGVCITRTLRRLPAHRSIRAWIKELSFSWLRFGKRPAVSQGGVGKIPNFWTMQTWSTGCIFHVSLSEHQTSGIHIQPYNMMYGILSY